MNGRFRTGRERRSWQRLHQPRNHGSDRSTTAVRWLEEILRRFGGEGRGPKLCDPIRGRWKDVVLSPNQSPSKRSHSLRKAWEQWFRNPTDPSRLRSEANPLRYLPYRGVFLRVASLRNAEVSLLEYALTAAWLACTPVHLSLASTESDPTPSADVQRLLPLGHPKEFKGIWDMVQEVVVETAEEAAARLEKLSIEMFLRLPFTRASVVACGE